MAIRSDEGVDFLHLDTVQIFSGGLDLGLVGGEVDNENKGVVVLDLLHGGLSGKRELDNIERLVRLKALADVGQNLWLAGKLKSLGLVEVHLGVHSGGLAAGALLQSTGGLGGLGNRLGSFVYKLNNKKKKESKY